MNQPRADGRRVVVVVGFHRSGTSMVTRMLNLLGVDLGDEAALLPPEERDNARGYWEPRWMNELNEELLVKLGSGTFEPFDPAPGWERSPELEPLRDRARTLLAEHFAEVPVWGWKDPRTSLTLPFWRGLVDLPMSFVICVRSPADAVASALKRGLTDLHRWNYAERWLDYTAHALENTAGDERLLMFYEDALRDPADETRRLARFLGIDEPGGEQLEQVVASVDPELRHHTTNALDVAVDPGLPIGTRALYLLLRARREIERTGDAGPAQARLASALERVGCDLRATHEQMRELHGTRQAALEQADREREALARATAHGDELAAELERERAARRTEDARREQERDAQLVARDEQLAARDAMVADRDARIADLEALVNELKGVVGQRDAAIDTYARSLSWRVTRPLRALGARARKAR